MPLHLPDKRIYLPAIGETVTAVIVNQDRRERYNFLDVITGISRGLDSNCWKEAYKIVESDGRVDAHCPGLLYRSTVTHGEVLSRMVERLSAYIFATPVDQEAGSNTDNESETITARGNSPRVAEDMEYCPICADQRTYWAVSPPVFLSRNARRWHLHHDCFQVILPRCQFKLEPVQMVDYM